jgi:hypothetical protein
MMNFTEDDIRREVEDPECPFTFEELWDLLLAPRGRSILELIDELEGRREDGQCKKPPDSPPGSP